MTRKVRTVHANDLEGICHVMYSRDVESIDEWVKRDDHFFVNQVASTPNVKSLDELQDWPEDQFRYCMNCRQDHDDIIRRQTELWQRHGHLRGMELFSGKL